MNRGDIRVLGHRLRVSHALISKTVALRPTDTDGVYDIWFRHVRLKTIAGRASGAGTPNVALSWISRTPLSPGPAA